MKSKQKIFNILKICIFSFILILLLNKTYKVLSWKDGVGGYASASNTLYSMEDDLVDVLFLGSSHCYFSIDNSILWDKYGLSSFSMTISGQDLASTYYSMREVFKTQTPEAVFIELYGTTFEKHGIQGNLYRNALALKYSENFFGIIDAIVPENDKKDFILKWPIIHTRYKELQKEDFKATQPGFIGSYFISETTDIGELSIYKGNDTVAISETNQAWLQKIIDFAKEKNTDLYFFVIPYSASEDTQKEYKYIEKLAAEQNVLTINFFDIFDEIAINTKTDYCDSGHTNSSGAEKITSYIGDYIAEKYNFTDHRGDNKYHLWTEDSIAMQHKRETNDISSVYSIAKYFEKLSDFNNYTIIVASNGNHIYDGIDITSDLKKIGIDSSFIKNGGIWVIDSGKVLFNEKNGDISYHANLSQHSLTITGADGENLIAVDRSTYRMVDNGINIVVYDNILGTVADSIGFNAANEYDGNR